MTLFTALETTLCGHDTSFVGTSTSTWWTRLRFRKFCKMFPFSRRTFLSFLRHCLWKLRIIKWKTIADFQISLS